MCSPNTADTILTMQDPGLGRSLGLGPAAPSSAPAPVSAAAAGPSQLDGPSSSAEAGNGSDDANTASADGDTYISEETLARHAPHAACTDH